MTTAKPVTFKELYDHSVITNVMGWNSAVTPTTDIQNLSDTLNIEQDRMLKEFMKSNPLHPITIFNAPLQLSSDLVSRKVKAESKLWQKYTALKKDKSPADDEYYDLFDTVIALCKEACDEVGIPHTEYMYFNDPLIGEYEAVKSIVDFMAGISRQFVQNRWESDKPFHFWKDVAVESKLLPYLEENNIQYTIGDTNGSFMTAIDENTARIHIKKTDCVGDMMSSGFHEAGHALYQTQILSKNTEVGKIGGCISLSLHETASIYFEREHSCFISTVWDFGDRRNMTRLGADKIHYIIHIYIRMTIEEMLFKNEIKSRDIPKVWKDLMQKYFGLTPENDWEGFLQDVHWSSGAFGYFHSYAIGFFNAITFESSNLPLKVLDKKLAKYNEYSYDIMKDLHPDMDKSKKLYVNNVRSFFSL